MRRHDALLVAAVLVALLLSALSAPQLAQLLPRDAPEPERAAPRRAPQPVAAAKDAGRKINVKLYFEKQQEPSLQAEEREVVYAADLSEQIRTVVEELIKGSTAGRLPPFPPETKVHGVFVSARGTAYVDLSKEAAGAGATGSLGERLSVYALIDSITANFPAIRRVQILVDDKPAETLAGHIDLSRPLPADMTLVAVEAPPLARAPEDAPAAQPTPTPPPAL
jgi:hypothetical protein